MLARSHGSRLNHNAENPGGGHLPHKTPARPVAGKSAAPPATVGKGALQNTARSGRVLGAKDRNLAKGSDQAGQGAFITLRSECVCLSRGVKRALQEMRYWYL